MPPDVSVAPSMPAVSSLPQQLPAPASSAGNGTAQVVSAAFGGELAKALAVPAQPDQPAAAADTAAAPPAGAAAQQPTPAPQQTAAAPRPTAAATPAAPAPPAASQTQPAAPAPSTTLQPIPAASSPPQPAVGSVLPLPTAAPVASASATAATAPSASHDAGTSKKPGTRDATPVRRSAARVAPRRTQTDQQPVAPLVASSPQAAAPVSDGAADAAQPAVSQANAATPEASSGGKPATATVVAAKTVAASPAAADPPPQSPSPAQDLPATTSAQPADPSPAVPAAAVPTTPTAPTQQAAPATTPAAASTTPARAASPAAQLAPALVQIGHASDGAQRLTVRLDPPELGHVQVRIDRPSEAPARVEITVEKSETLTLLLRDQPQLQRALDQAGVPMEGRSVTFHVAPSDPAQRSEPTTAPAPGVAAGGPSGDGWHGATRNGGQPSHRQAGNSGDAETEFIPVASPRWMRAGLDITA